jgi:hypothetical protein
VLTPEIHGNFGNSRKFPEIPGNSRKFPEIPGNYNLHEKDAALIIFFFPSPWSALKLRKGPLIKLTEATGRRATSTGMSTGIVARLIGGYFT